LLVLLWMPLLFLLAAATRAQRLCAQIPIFVP